MKAYWWRGHTNFGDRLTPLLLEQLMGTDVEWAAPAAAEWVACGSVLSHLPPGWTGSVWGTGRESAQPTDLNSARVLALRGRLTAELTEVHGDFALGDPGLLADRLPYRVQRSRVAVGVFPHWQDRQLAHRFKGLVIRAETDPLTLIGEIASCERLITSSLHGLVVADALGIPRRWETFSRIQGRGFKFRDYASVIGPFEPGDWVQADRSRVEAVQHALLHALSEVEAPAA